MKYSPLQQKVLHFLDHSIQPDSSLIPKHHIKVEDLLFIRHLSLPVVYWTQCTASGCGAQQLTSSELEKLWNISYSLTFTALLLILANILQMLLHQLVLVTPVHETVAMMRKTPQIHVEDPCGIF